MVTIVALAFTASLSVPVSPVQAAVAPSTPSYAPLVVAKSSTEVEVRADRRGVTGTPTTMTLFAVEAPGRSCSVTTNPEWQWCTITGLSPNESYTFRQTASNADGTSGASPASSPVTLPSAVYSVGSEPRGVAISPNRVHAWIANSASNTVSRIALADGTVTSIATGSTPLGVVADDTFAYVTNSGDNSLTRVRASDGSVTTLSNVCTTPQDIVLAPDGATAFVACSGNNVIGRVDLSGFTLGTPISVAGGAQYLAIDSSGQNLFTWEASTLSRIQLSDDSLAASVSLSDVVGVVADNSNVFTLGHGSGTLRKHDKLTLAQTSSVNTGWAAGGLALDATTGTAYSVVTNEHGVKAVDTASMTIVRTITLGDCTHPRSAAISSTGAFMVVSSTCGGGRGWNYALGIPDRPGIPPQPTVAQATATSATVTVTSGAGGIPISFTVTTVEDPARQCTVTGSSGSCPVTGLTTGNTYTFTATATNSGGTSLASVASAPITLATPTAPGAPTVGSWTPHSTQVDLSWSAPSNGGSPITGYRIQWSDDSSAGPFDDSVTVGNVLNGTVTGLINGMTYWFRVAAINAIGAGTDSASTPGVTPRTVPGAPTSVTATAGDTQASVSWSAPSSTGGSVITSYTATASPGGAVCTTASTSCTVTGLSNGTNYTFTVTATNAAGSGAASAASSAVTPQSSPTPTPTPRPPRPTPTPTPTPSPTPTPTPTPTPSPTPTPTPTPTPSPTPTEQSLDGVVIPAPDGYSGLPPAPVSVSATRQVREGTRVEVVLPEGAAGISVQGTVVTVRDRDGRVAARVTVTTPAGEIRADVQVPYVGPGFTVTAYNVNANGVSPGASITSPLVRASTLSSTPGQRYIGTRVGKPIAFAKGSARLDASDKAQLRATATRLKTTFAPVYVTGHAGEERGTPATLSLQRARSVA